MGGSAVLAICGKMRKIMIQSIGIGLPPVIIAMASPNRNHGHWNVLDLNLHFWDLFKLMI